MSGCYLHHDGNLLPWTGRGVSDHAAASLLAQGGRCASSPFYRTAPTHTVCEARGYLAVLWTKFLCTTADLIGVYGGRVFVFKPMTDVSKVYPGSWSGHEEAPGSWQGVAIEVAAR